MDDLTSELDLRKVEPPWEAVRDETERVAHLRVPSAQVLASMEHPPGSAEVCRRGSAPAQPRRAEVYFIVRELRTKAGPGAGPAAAPSISWAFETIEKFPDTSAHSGVCFWIIIAFDALRLPSSPVVSRPWVTNN
jgi:hypothetical protein